MDSWLIPALIGAVGTLLGIVIGIGMSIIVWNSNRVVDLMIRIGVLEDARKKK